MNTQSSDRGRSRQPKAWKKTTKIRPRIQRAFFAWLDEAQPRMTQDIVILRRTDQRIDFSFGPGTEILLGFLDRVSLSISVEYEGECWDLLADYDVFPKKVAGGYICTACPPDAQSIHASREALWHDHLFAPLFQWVNETLTGAQSVALYQTETGGVTWAKILRETEADPDAFRVIKLEGQGNANI